MLPEYNAGTLKQVAAVGHETKGHMCRLFGAFKQHLYAISALVNSNQQTTQTEISNHIKSPLLRRLMEQTGKCMTQ